MTVSVTDQIRLKERLKIGVKRPSFAARGHICIEQLMCDDLYRNTGKWRKRVRVIDRENNRYLETITDPDTGEVVHHCEEPLIDHRGHGSAKHAPQRG